MLVSSQDDPTSQSSLVVHDALVGIDVTSSMHTFELRHSAPLAQSLLDEQITIVIAIGSELTPKTSNGSSACAVKAHSRSATPINPPVNFLIVLPPLVLFFVDSTLIVACFIYKSEKGARAPDSISY